MLHIQCLIINSNNFNCEMSAQPIIQICLIENSLSRIIDHVIGGTPAIYPVLFIYFIDYAEYIFYKK